MPARISPQGNMLMTLFKKATLATVLAATALTAATPAMARPYYDRHRSDNTGAIVAGGIIGLVLGAAIASSSNRHDRYENRGWTWRNGAYWDREGRRYDRDGRRFDSDGYARRGYDSRYYGDRGYYGGGSYGSQYYGGGHYGY